jgi:hypothetical protein
MDSGGKIRMYEASKRWLSRNLIFIVLALAYASLLLAFVSPPALLILKEYSTLIVGTLVLIAVVVYLRGTLAERTRTELRLREYQELKLGETHPVLYKQIAKFVTIENEKGNATVDYRMESKNTCEDQITQLVHEVQHDGKIELFNPYIEGKPATTTCDRYIKKKVKNGEILPSLANILKITFDLKKEAITPGRSFSYGYTVKYSAVFRDMFERDFTAQRIMHPTYMLIMHLTAPEGLKFMEKSIEVVDKHEVRVVKEERRCNDHFPPVISRDGKILLWEIPEPQIACTYNLFFRVSKE